MALILAFLTLSISGALAHLGCGTDKIKFEAPHKNWNVKPLEYAASTTNVGNKQARSQDPDPTMRYWDNIRITVHTEHLESDWSDEDDLLDFFIDDAIPAAFEWIQNVFSVMPVDGNLTFERSCSVTWDNGRCESLSSALCNNYSHPANMLESKMVCPATESDDYNETACYNTTQGFGVNADLIVYVGADSQYDGTDSCDGVMGFASACETNSFDRPIAGTINFCKETIDLDDNTFEEIVTLIVHETFHILGFNSDMFGYFRYNDTNRTARSPRNSNGKPTGISTNTIASSTLRGKTRSYVVLPTVLEKVREMFDCDDMIGMELEEFGYSTSSIASHWDARILLADAMISYVTRASTVSAITLALFADSGWYQIDWDYAVEGAFGRHVGCEWYEDKCITNDKTIDDYSFCTEQTDSCGATLVGKYNCDTYEWSSLPSAFNYFGDGTTGGAKERPDYCPYYQMYGNLDCRLYGDDSHASDSDDAETFGGLISGDSKCFSIESTHNDPHDTCYPSKCIRNYQNSYVAIRVSTFRNYKYKNVDVLTCWDGDYGDALELNYVPTSDTEYGYNTIYCPQVSQVCYDGNPWICSGHGMMNSEGDCKCNPGYFGVDCSIENKHANRKKYDDTDSVSIFNSDVCSDYDFGWKDTDENIGILEVTVSDVDDSDYVEAYFQSALQNWIAVLAEINACDVDIRDYVYSDSDESVKCDIYYYTSSQTYTKNKADSSSVFKKLFDSSMSISVDVQKESDADDPYYVDASPRTLNSATNIVFSCFFLVFFLL